MKYYALKYKYKYKYALDRTYNIGDNFQTLAVIETLKKSGIDINNIGLLNRDDLGIEKEKDCGILIMQGWFNNTTGCTMLPIRNNNIYPLYYGFHITKDSWHGLKKNREFISSMKSSEPIGCRDIGTRDFLRSLGIKAYFSKCLTMTFNKIKTKHRKEITYLIDNDKEVEKNLPKDKLKNSIRLTQSMRNASYHWPFTNREVEQINTLAKDRIEKISNNASLIVTSRIHVAMPFSAMGIPVIFTFPDKSDERISVVKEILPIYSNPEEYRNIKLDIKSPKMEELKKEILLLFNLRLQQIEKKLGLKTKRLSDRDVKIYENLLEKKCKIDEQSKKNIKRIKRMKMNNIKRMKRALKILIYFFLNIIRKSKYKAPLKTVAPPTPPKQY